ncbi:response regulator [Candidatus Ferrigenium straubiae]|jgi:DNA-binding NarL/FixJ family response regulator|uniref:response regulator n=1 Tax=Candidatus Ferrigenium straubiae TaxID=2919506 RepID=UPI003F4AC1B8
MGKKKRILIIEDYPLLRIGIRTLLSREADIEVAGESDDSRDAALLVKVFAADLVLMDLPILGMSGMEAIADIKRHHPDTRVLVLTMHKAVECVHGSLLAGADGYVLKDDAHDELRTAIRCVLNGKKYLSYGISATNGCLDARDSLNHGKGHYICAVRHATDWR